MQSFISSFHISHIQTNGQQYYSDEDNVPSRIYRNIAESSTKSIPKRNTHGGRGKQKQNLYLWQEVSQKEWFTSKPRYVALEMSFT